MTRSLPRPWKTVFVKQKLTEMNFSLRKDSPSRRLLSLQVRLFFFWLLMINQVGCEKKNNPELPIEALRENVFAIDPENYSGPLKHLTKPGAIFVPAKQPTPNAQGVSSPAGFLGPESCRDCHSAHVDSCADTAHYRTFRLPTPDSLPDSFQPQKNVLVTSVSELSFHMNRRGDEYFQDLRIQRNDQTYVHSRRIDYVTGSAKYGQTFLYVENQCFYELPVSHFTDLGEWVNSPGYVDGVANFARPISSRCLECHTTWFRQDGKPFNRFNDEGAVFGITCEKCHGPGQEHIDYHRRNPAATEPAQIINPGHLSRDLSIDLCSLCHSGVGEAVKPAFSFRPGDKLTDFVTIPPDSESGPGGVHSANQQARMALSKCFQQSSDMQCTTCHNPHHQERGNAKLFIERCFKCHESGDCRIVRETGAAAESRCIDCHMPSRADSQMPMQKEKETFRPMLRDHLIDIWDDKTAEVLKEIASGGSKP